MPGSAPFSWPKGLPKWIRPWCSQKIGYAPELTNIGCQAGKSSFSIGNTWVFPKIGGKPPKWMVKIMEKPIKINGWFGGTPIFGNTNIFKRWIFQPAMLVFGGGIAQNCWSTSGTTDAFFPNGDFCTCGKHKKSAKKGTCNQRKLWPNKIVPYFQGIFWLTLGIQSSCQWMIGVSNHLLSQVFRFHYHSQKVSQDP